MDSGRDPGLEKMLLELIPVFGADHVEVVDSPGPSRLMGNGDAAGGEAKQLLIAIGNVPALFIPFLEMLELQSQDAGLNRIQPAVVSFEFVIILLRLPVVAQHPDFLCKLFIVGRNRARFSASAQVFSWIEAKCGRAAHRASPLPTILLLRKVFCTVGLASIFDDDQVVSLGKLKDGTHVRHLAVQVHGNDSCNRSSRLFVEQFLGHTVEVALCFQVFLKFHGIHGVSALIDIHEVRTSAGLGDGLGGRDKSVGDCNDGITRTDPGSDQGEPQSIRSASDADAILHIAELGKIFFEVFHHRPANETSGLQGVPEDRH